MECGQCIFFYRKERGLYGCFASTDLCGFLKLFNKKSADICVIRIPFIFIFATKYYNYV
jgi:hypothetical protein